MEKKCHSTVKRILCKGKYGTEHPLASGKRIDCRVQSSSQCYEVERHSAGLQRAVKRLQEGMRTGVCRGASLVTDDALVIKARTAANGTSIKVLPISKVKGITGST